VSLKCSVTVVMVLMLGTEAETLSVNGREMVRTDIVTVMTDIVMTAADTRTTTDTETAVTVTVTLARDHTEMMVNVTEMMVNG